MNPEELPGLLPCPFCGGGAAFAGVSLRLNDGFVFPANPWVVCGDCGIRTGGAVSRVGMDWEDNFRTGAAAEAATWNRRPAGRLTCETSSNES